MSDRIEPRAMRFEGRHGVLPFESDEAQPFEVDVVLELDQGPRSICDRCSTTGSGGQAVASSSNSRMWRYERPVARVIAISQGRLTDAQASQ